MSLVYFITHPDVVIDPDVPVPQWPLSAQGKERMKKIDEGFPFRNTISPLST